MTLSHVVFFETYHFYPLVVEHSVLEAVSKTLESTLKNTFCFFLFENEFHSLFLFHASPPHRALLHIVFSARSTEMNYQHMEERPGLKLYLKTGDDHIRLTS